MANNPYLFAGPYILLFFVFIVLPVATSMALSLTDFNSFTFPPNFIGLRNYVSILTEDNLFMQRVLPNTINFALIVGPVSYILAFLLAWMLAQISPIPRAVLALIIYSPTMTAGVALRVVWGTLFSGYQDGYVNSFLLQTGLIVEPIQFLQSPEYLFGIMVLVSIWGSMGVGFLAMLAGILNINAEMYEAAYVDGLRNRYQEIIYVTIPSMRPQMLFGAVMSILGTFQAGAIGVELSGYNPTPNYAGQLLVNHMDDYGFIRFQMGYAAALAVILLLIIYAVSRFVWRVLGEPEDA